MYENEISLIPCTENLKRHKLKIALIFPNSYYIGMSNLGLHRILQLLCSQNKFFIERVYFEKNQIKLNYLKNCNKLRDFDIIIFSVSFKDDFKNVEKILDFLNIKPGLNPPFLLGGGMALTINPQQIINKFDFIFQGEIDNCFNIIIEYFIHFKENKISNIKLRNELLKIKGLTDKENYKNNKINLINKIKPAHTVILTPDTEFKNTFLIEIARSCCYKCKFCFIGNTGFFRIIPGDIIINTIRKIKPYTDKVGLVASDVLSHPDIMKIFKTLIKEGFRVSFSSFRADLLTEEFIKLYAENYNKTITLAPETGSAKLKRLINKNIPEDKILEITHWVAKYRLKKLKLYLLIGLPEETEEDIIDTINLVLKVKKILYSYRKELKYMPLLHLSINQFIPEKNTPFEKFTVPDRFIIRSRVKLIKKALCKEGNLKIKFCIIKK